MIDRYELPGYIDNLFELVPETALEAYKRTQGLDKDLRALNQEWHDLFARQPTYKKIIDNFTFFFCSMVLNRDSKACAERKAKMRYLTPIRETFAKKVEILTKQFPENTPKDILRNTFAQGNITAYLGQLALVLVQTEYRFKNICRCAERDTIRRALNELDRAQVEFDPCFGAAMDFGLVEEKDRKGIFDRANAISKQPEPKPVISFES